MEKAKLVPRNIELPEIRTVLSSEALDNYNEGLCYYGENARKHLDIFSDFEGTVAGSNCFAPLAFKKYLPSGTRLATMGDFGLARETVPNFFEKYSSDVGIFLATGKDSHSPNDFLARDLTSKLETFGISLKKNLPLILYFDALDIEESEDSLYGLKYTLSPQAKVGVNIFSVPNLVESYTFNDIDDNGIPIKDNNGRRAISIEESGEGLSRYRLHALGDCSLDYKDLVESFPSKDRLAVVQEGSPQLSSLLAERASIIGPNEQKFIEDLLIPRD